MRTILSLVVCVALLGLVPAAHADCAVIPGNEIEAAVCGFETGDPPTGWTIVFGTASRNTSVFRSGAASGQVDAQSISAFDFRAEVDSSCFPLTARPGYPFGAFFRLISGTTSPTCFVQLFWYSDAACTNLISLAGTSGVFPTTGAWALATATATTAGTHGRLHLQCRTTTLSSDFVVVLDDAFAAAAEILIADFEEGDLSEWSAQVGGEP